MSRKFLTPIDLTQNELQNPLLQNLATNPLTPLNGQFWLNTATGFPTYKSTTGIRPFHDNRVKTVAPGIGSPGINVDSTDSENIKLTVSGLVNSNIASGAGINFEKLTSPIASFSFGNQRITNLAAPISDTDAANKGYVDAARAGLDVKPSVRVATTSNINLSSPAATIDGITLITGDRILVKDQSTTTQNGIYEYNGSGVALTRSTDADSNAKVTAGMFTFVTEGNTNADSGFVLTTDDAITLGTTPLVFTQFSGSNLLSAGAGLTKTGNSIDVISASNSRIVVSADSIDLAFIGTAGTYTQVTTDAYGRITAGTSPTTLAGYGITDAQPLSTQLTSLANLSTNGFVARTATNTLTSRSFNGTTNRITVTNGNGISADPIVDISSVYVGQASITTLGTVTTGTWNGSIISVAYGGTGGSTAAAAKTNLGFLTRYAIDVGDGTSTSIVLTHNLNSRDVAIQIYRNSAPYDEVIVDIERTTVNTATITFSTAPSTAAFRAVCVG